jgi:uncharacterized membrane protein
MANRIGETAGMNKARVESFSDGVLAFAITLLVLSIPIPDSKSADDLLLSTAPPHAIPQLAPYVTSFATIGIIWLNHHSLFDRVEKVRHTTLTPKTSLGIFFGLAAFYFLPGRPRRNDRRCTVDRGLFAKDGINRPGVCRV